MKSRIGFLFLILALAFAGMGSSCDPPAQSTSGVAKVTAEIPTGPDGMTVEQRNIKDRLAMDNKPGSIKHLYIISAYSGQVILYSTVKGKVTSSGKRLTPYSANYTSNSAGSEGFRVNLPNGEYFRTSEVLQDDGTYGESIPYIYWWDVTGKYRQIYVSGGTIVMLSDQPLPVKSITMNLEVSEQKQ
jgi:hypothetical protein